ncbi:MAG: DUF4381 domain-containing protein [Gammaproteobacteria bacterium]|nr:DUF4381 domain-containing protein [Gammaproteobacteria bacterium]
MDPTELPLRDLHLPEAVSWWPLAPGWWFIIAVLAGLLVWLLRRAFDNWRANAPRRFAIRELGSIESDFRQHGNAVLMAQKVSELLRRSMLAYAPRNEVAGLTGESWLQWLDNGLSVPYFHTEGGKSLLQLPYRDPESDVSDVDTNALLAAAKMRLATPVRGRR